MLHVRTVTVVSVAVALCSKAGAAVAEMVGDVPIDSLDTGVPIDTGSESGAHAASHSWGALGTSSEQFAEVN